MNFDLSKAYHREEALSYLQSEFLPEDFVLDEQELSLPSSHKKIAQAFQLGYCPSLNLYVYEFKHLSESDPRVSITREIFQIIARSAQERALAFVFNPKDNNYRLSLVTLTVRAQGKSTNKEFSSPRRYSYVLGPDAKINTPKIYILNKGRVKDFADLQSRFSIEVVNREFFEKIAKAFMELAGGKLKLPASADHQKKKEFTVRLIGRIIFCWFLKKIRSDSGLPLIPDHLMSSELICHCYYHTTMEPIFFQILNKKVENRHQCFDDEKFRNIPFLNGGLFEPHQDDYYRFNENTGYSDGINTVDIPDKWFKDFFKVLEEYNFTIDENTSSDIDLSVDPEMLGRIFENLLAEINPETGETARKSTGSFYTPREIVDFMVTQSLKKHLAVHTSLSQATLDALLEDHLTEEAETLSSSQKQEIIHAISQMKIIDPACGSGAYPMGVLQKTVSLLHDIDPEAEQWINYQVKNIPNSANRQKMKEEIQNNLASYHFKKVLIEDILYGVDIQQIAVEISKLRVFLSLIVEASIDDQKENRGIDPLPNLEFKFLSANSLIRLATEIPTLSSAGSLMQDLKDLRTRYYLCSDPDEKDNVKKLFQKTQENLLNEALKWSSKNLDVKKAKMLSSWDPFSHNSAEWFDPLWMFGLEEGFDIVIGNPPYIQLQSMKDNPVHAQYKDQNYQTFEATGDIYGLFYERGMELLKEQGTLCYITSNKWMRTRYGEKLRKYFSGLNPQILIDLGPGVFASATVDTNILIMQKGSNQQQLRAVSLTSSSGDRPNLQLALDAQGVTLSTLSQEVWFIGDQTELALKAKIERLGKPLKDWDVEIYRGVTTGLNDAFIIDTPTRDRLVEENPKSAEILKPVLGGKNLVNYSYVWSGLWLISTFPVLKADIEDYPSVKAYFINYGKDRLEQVGKSLSNGTRSRKLTGNKWYETQDQIAYWKEFDKEKVAWLNLNRKWKFSFVDPGVYLEASLNFLSSKTDASFFTGVLSSSIHLWYFKKIGRMHDRGGYMCKIDTISAFPIPEWNSENDRICIQIKYLSQQVISKKKKNPESNTLELEQQINQLVYQLYQLTPEEIALVEKDE